MLCLCLCIAGLHPNLSKRLPNISRAILATQPGLPNLPGPDVGNIVKLILLYLFVCLSAGHFL